MKVLNNMKLKIKLLFHVIYLLSVFQLSAQLDYNPGTKEKGETNVIILNNSKEVLKPNSLDLQGNNGFKNAYKKENEKLKKMQKEKALNTKGILTKELARKIKFQKFIEKNTLQIPMIDKDIGVFRTKSANIYLNAFDFGRIDGDQVTVLKNGKPYIAKFTLFNRQKTKTIVIPLDEGFNLIEIVAIHEGNYRPNTGAFTLFDDENNEVFSDLWALAKGAKVIGHIIREKK